MMPPSPSAAAAAAAAGNDSGEASSSSESGADPKGGLSPSHAELQATALGEFRSVLPPPSFEVGRPGSGSPLSSAWEPFAAPSQPLVQQPPHAEEAASLFSLSGAQRGGSGTRRPASSARLPASILRSAPAIPLHVPPAAVSVASSTPPAESHGATGDARARPPPSLSPQRVDTSSSRYPRALYSPRILEDPWRQLGAH
jgi:hypothetical protein